MNVNESIAKKDIVRVLEKLKTKLIDFSVQTSGEETIGVIQDIKVNKKGQIYLVISKPGTENSAIYLSSRAIKKIDNPNQTIMVTELHNHLDEIESIDDLADTNSEIVEEEVVRLLEERLVIDRHKRKVGEVVVRKVVETRMVEVPVQREKLIIEQVGSEDRPLAEIDLGKGEVTGVELQSKGFSADGKPTVKGKFVSVKAASDLLGAIALQKSPGCAEVRIELILDNPQKQQPYQEMFDRCHVQ